MYHVMQSTEVCAVFIHSQSVHQFVKSNLKWDIKLKQQQKLLLLIVLLLDDDDEDDYDDDDCDDNVNILATCPAVVKKEHVISHNNVYMQLHFYYL
jgi:hypothetical protein